MEKQKVTWLDRTIAAGPQLALVTNQLQLSSTLEEDGIEDVQWDFNTPGCANISYTSTKAGMTCLVVCGVERMEAEGDSILIAASLVHEAVHVYQIYREHAPVAGMNVSTADEFEAYAIQNITSVLLREYARVRDEFFGKSLGTQSSSPSPSQKEKATVHRGAVRAAHDVS